MEKAALEENISCIISILWPRHCQRSPNHSQSWMTHLFATKLLWLQKGDDNMPHYQLILFPQLSRPLPPESPLNNYKLSSGFDKGHLAS